MPLERSAERSGAKGEWWRGGVIYQVYPRSFLDTSGSGEGDLAGITARIDYIAALGVDAIWLSPVFPSPMFDSGYDVSDFCGIDPRFGTLEDFDALVSAAHARNVRVIIDQIYSHSSDQHAWFKQSRKSRSNDKSDWYVWADPKPDGTPPNNWLSVFRGPAWSWDTERSQYYLHNFLPQQPDLDLSRPEVQDALLDVVRFWLDRGVDGVRLDVANFYCCDPDLRDNPPADMPSDPRRPYRYQRHVYDKSRPETLRFLERLRGLLDTYPGRMAVAEIEDDEPLARTAEYTQEAAGRLHTAYNFVYLAAGAPLTPDLIRKPLEAWREHAEGSWPSWAFSNHDVPRARTRLGGPSASRDFALLLNALLLSLPGTVFLYQGEELGLPQAHVPYERLQDPEALRSWPHTLGRDGARTPMPWAANMANGGFSEREPWLPMDPQALPLAVDRQEADPTSVLARTRRLIKLRRTSPELRSGDIEFFDAKEPILAYARGKVPERLVFLFNLSDRPRSERVPTDAAKLLDWPLEGKLTGEEAVLPPYSGLALREDASR